MKFISWNVDGFFSALKKRLVDFVKEEQADFYCLQEIRSSRGKVEKKFDSLDNYYQNWLFGEKKGYSGVAVFSKEEPQSVQRGLGYNKIDQEGRVITLEYPNFYLVNSYFPHTQRKLKRLDFKLEFNQKWTEFIEKLRQEKNVVLCGDFNVAHQPIDLANPKNNHRNAGFTDEERDWLTSFLKKGYLDTFRLQHPKEEKYSWWTYRFNARKRNIGWRIDYFLINKALKEKINNTDILTKVHGSDHAPILLELGLDKKEL